MDAFSDAKSTADAAEIVGPYQAGDARALWDALEADHRARDERTARLRAMRLIGGDDEAA
jgi:hypothetical protein